LTRRKQVYLAGFDCVVIASTRISFMSDHLDSQLNSKGSITTARIGLQNNHVPRFLLDSENLKRLKQIASETNNDGNR